MVKSYKGQHSNLAAATPSMSLDGIEGIDGIDDGPEGTTLIEQTGQRLPNELLAIVIQATSRSTLRSLALVNTAVAGLARPLLWRRLHIDTARMTRDCMSAYLAAPMWNRVGLFLRQLSVHLHSSPSTPALCAAISAILVRAPALVQLRLEVGAGVGEEVRAVLDSVQYMTAVLESFLVEWYTDIDQRYQMAVFEAVRRHAKRLRVVNFYVDMGTTIDPEELASLSSLTALTLGRVGLQRDLFEEIEASDRVRHRRLVYLDLDSSTDFPTICAIVLPLIPNIRTLVFYLVYPGMDEALAPLPTLDHLLKLEIRSVDPAELHACLFYFGTLPALAHLVISAPGYNLVETADTLIDVLGNSSRSSSDRVPSDGMPSDGEPDVRNEAALSSPVIDRALPALSTLLLDYEDDGEPPEPGTDDWHALVAAIGRLRPIMALRRVAVTAPMLERGQMEVDEQ